MSLAANGGVAFTPSDGTKRTVDLVPRWAVQFVTDKGTAYQAMWNDAYCLRTGMLQTGLMPSGANTATGIDAGATKGRPHLYFDSSAGTNKDFLSLIPVRCRIVQPTSTIVTPFEVWEVEADLWADTPANAPTDDIGLAFHGNCSTSGWANGITVGQAVGDPGSCGFAIVYDVGGSIRWKARNGLAAVPLTGNVLIDGGNWFDKWTRFKLRFESARVGINAQVSLFMNDVLMRVEPWVTGSTMLPDSTLNNYLAGCLRPFVRNHNPAVSTNLLRCSHFRIGAASSLANLLGA